MQSTELEFIIDTDGNVQTTVRGVKGPGCSEIVEKLNDLGTVTRQEKTGDFYKTPAINVGTINSNMTGTKRG